MARRIGTLYSGEIFGTERLEQYVVLEESLDALEDGASRSQPLRKGCECDFKQQKAEGKGRAGQGLARISQHVEARAQNESPADYVMLQLAHLRLCCIQRVQVNYLRRIFF